MQGHVASGNTWEHWEVNPRSTLLQVPEWPGPARGRRVVCVWGVSPRRCEPACCPLPRLCFGSVRSCRIQVCASQTSQHGGQSGPAGLFLFLLWALAVQQGHLLSHRPCSPLLLPAWIRTSLPAAVPLPVSFDLPSTNIYSHPSSPSIISCLGCLPMAPYPWPAECVLCHVSRATCPDALACPCPVLRDSTLAFPMQTPSLSLGGHLHLELF